LPCPHSTIFVVEENDQLIGFLALLGQPIRRIAHRASLVIGILKDYQGKGIGRQLLMAGEANALAHGINRLELTVMTTNKRALWLYGSLGFTVEGIRHRAMWVGGQWVDEFYMSKLLAVT